MRRSQRRGEATFRFGAARLPAAFALLLLAAITGAQPAVGQSALAEIERRVERDHPGIPHLAGDALAAKLTEPAGLLVLDVREANEFSVSHIPGAVRVDPGISERDFMARFGSALQGRTVVLYCSVGVRSSRLGLRIAASARAAGASDVQNLRGGIFGWANRGLPLVDQSGGTSAVHPYNRSWGRYVEDQSRARYEPAPR